jgi:hypothetical protein
MNIKKVKTLNNPFYIHKFGEFVKEVWVIRDRYCNREKDAKKRQWVIGLGCPENSMVKTQNTWIFIDEKFAMLFYLKFNKS